WQSPFAGPTVPRTKMQEDALVLRVGDGRSPGSGLSFRLPGHRPVACWRRVLPDTVAGAAQDIRLLPVSRALRRTPSAHLWQVGVGNSIAAAPKCAWRQGAGRRMSGSS